MKISLEKLNFTQEWRRDVVVVSTGEIYLSSGWYDDLQTAKHLAEQSMNETFTTVLRTRFVSDTVDYDY